MKNKINHAVKCHPLWCKVCQAIAGVVNSRKNDERKKHIPNSLLEFVVPQEILFSFQKMTSH